MITLITGAPGSGKSLALVTLLKTLSKDRAIYVHGIPDLTLPHQDLASPERWHLDVPDGSIIVIDEVQNVWRPRGPGQKVPDHVSALETHRHRGLDFYIVTQGPNLLDTNVRALVGRHVHLRDVGVLGRWWYEWPECTDNPRTGWKNAPLKKRYKVDKSSFALYKSASVHIKPIRSFPIMLIVAVAALIGTFALAFAAWRVIQSRLPGGSVYGPPSASLSVPAALPSASPVAAHLPESLSSMSLRPAYIEDVSAFTPRISSRPETAPAYDDLRRVVSMPTIIGAICSTAGRCICVTNQGTDARVPDSDCADWLKNPPFDPYRIAVAPQPAQIHAQSAISQNGQQNANIQTSSKTP